ncbi:MAG: S-layer homology domain-containing protein [Clostridia bacterium]|nr:S-layer homology domain-containing protein [Clostridia bacterium]
MKKTLTLLLSVLMLTQSIGFVSHGSEIPENVSEIEFDRQYWLESGEVAWHKFEAPAPLCYLTDMPVEEIDGFPCGWNVDSNLYYDKNGKCLGSISASNDPETGGWTSFTPGESYYLKVDASKGGVHYTLSAVKEKEPCVKAEQNSSVTNVELNLKKEGIERFIPGEYNTAWDVYTVKEHFSLQGEDVVTSSTFFLLPYRPVFENSRLTAAKGKVTYSVTERAYSHSGDTVKCYTKAPSVTADKNEYIFSANHYSFFLSAEGEAVREFDVSVPAGQKLVYSDKGYFYSAGAEDIFEDIPADSWYTDAVLFNSQNRYMKGTGEGKFSPDLVFTRAQMVQMLANIDGVDLDAYKDMQSFTDAKKGEWYTPAVEWANANNITKGIGGGKFDPNAQVSREQIAVFLCSYARMKGAELAEGSDLTQYTDSSSISSWAKDDFSRAVANGLIKGTTDTTLSPSMAATRSQIAVMTQRFDENILAKVRFSTHKGSYFLEGDSCGFATAYEIAELSGKEKPHVLYIGMASSDPAEGYGAVTAEFGSRLGCTTDYLSLEDLASSVAEEKIMNADIINVGGGDSRMLLSRLVKYGTDAIIRKAAANGTVMSGSSAGAICFGVWGTSGIGYERFQNLNATGCVDLIICPHGLEAPRVDRVKADLLENPDRIAVVVGTAALEIKDGMYRIYSESEFVELYGKEVVGMKYWVENGELKSEDLYNKDLEWKPLDELFVK